MSQIAATRSVERRLRRIFEERLNVESPPPELDIVEAGVLDSLTFVELLLALEQEFGISIDVAELDLDDFRSFERITRFLSLGGAS